MAFYNTFFVNKVGFTSSVSPVTKTKNEFKTGLFVSAIV